jgi:hypothetical protein
MVIYRVREVTMARATLGDGQSLLAFNDRFIGRKTHVFARYHLTHGLRSENQSSSGIIVSTGAGSTGWLSSVLNGAADVVEPFAGARETLEVTSQMPQDGVIFSHGVEADNLSFDSGAVASISLAEEKARLVAA